MNQTRNALKVTTPDDRSILFTREFNAPPSLVFDALTQAEHVTQWWGCSRSTVTSCEIDFRVGGKWRIVMSMPDGTEVPFCGEYKEIGRPNHLVRTEVYDVPPFNEHAATVTLKLTDLGGRTLMEDLMVFPNTETRDGALQSGMEQGSAESLDAMEELLQKLQGR